MVQLLDPTNLTNNDIPRTTIRARWNIFRFVIDVWARCPRTQEAHVAPWLWVTGFSPQAMFSQECHFISIQFLLLLHTSSHRFFTVAFGGFAIRRSTRSGVLGGQVVDGLSKCGTSQPSWPGRHSPVLVSFSLPVRSSSLRGRRFHPCHPKTCG